MNNDDIHINPAVADVAPPPPPPPLRPVSRRRVLTGRTAGAALAGGLVVGGIAGGYAITQAATTPAPSTNAASAPPFHGRGFDGGGPAARTQDLQQLATAIGVSVTQLQSELSAGKTVAAIAKAHNVSTSTVISALVADENAEIDSAVTTGRLTQAQATQLKTQTMQRVTAMVNGTAPAFGRGGFGSHDGGRQGLASEDQTVVAGAIGISSTQLRTELSAGKTIAAIATEHNVAATTVVSAWAASENSEIDQRISSGEITAAQGAQAKTETTQRLTDQVNGTETDGGRGGPWGGEPPAASGSAAAPTT